MSDPQDRGGAKEEPATPGPYFEGSAVLTEVLAWSGLPAVLRRSLTRAVPRETLERLTLAESVRALGEPALREWTAALLAHDIGVTHTDANGEEKNSSMIGLFASGELRGSALARFALWRTEGGQGIGASYRAPSPEAPATVCAAAFVYRDATGALESDFVFLAGATDEPVVQVELGWVAGRTFDARHIDHALRSLAGQVEPAHEESARAVLREALLECCAMLDRS